MKKKFKTLSVADVAETKKRDRIGPLCFEFRPKINGDNVDVTVQYFAYKGMDEYTIHRDKALFYQFSKEDLLSIIPDEYWGEVFALPNIAGYFERMYYKIREQTIEMLVEDDMEKSKSDLLIAFATKYEYLDNIELMARFKAITYLLLKATGGERIRNMLLEA